MRARRTSPLIPCPAPATHVPPTPCVGTQVRKLFVEPEVLPSAEVELKWTDPDEAGLVEFLVKEKVRESVCGVCVCVCVWAD